jgi:hypothetical protein
VGSAWPSSSNFSMFDDFGILTHFFDQRLSEIRILVFPTFSAFLSVLVVEGFAFSNHGDDGDPSLIRAYPT